MVHSLDNKLETNLRCWCPIISLRTPFALSPVAASVHLANMQGLRQAELKHQIPRDHHLKGQSERLYMRGINGYVNVCVQIDGSEPIAWVFDSSEHPL